MKIGIIQPHLTFEGGGERQIVWLAMNLKRLGHTVRIYCNRFESDHCFSEITKQLEIITLKESSQHSPVSQFLRKYTSDVVRLTKLCRRQDIPDVFLCQDEPSHWVGVMAKRRTAAKSVWLCNDLPSWHRLKKMDMWQRQYGVKGILAKVKSASYVLLRFVDKYFSRQIDSIVVLDNKNMHEIRRKYGKSATIVHSGVPPEKYHNISDVKLRGQLGVEEDDFMFLSVGTFMPHRNYETLLSAFQDFPGKAKLVIVGDPSVNYLYAEKIFNSVRMEDKKKIIFAGRVSEQELPAYYATCDCFVLPNIDQTWGLAVLEAMLSSRPVIVSEDAGITDVLQDENQALFFKSASKTDLSQKMRLIYHNKELREKIARGGYSKAMSITDKTFALEIQKVLALTLV